MVNAPRLRRGVLALILSLCAATALANLPHPASVPGGIAVVSLAPVQAGMAPPRAWFNDRQVLVTSRAGHWTALVGLPLDTKPGAHTLRAGPSKAQAHGVQFAVTAKKYPEQRITLQDKGKVELSAEALARVKREQSEISRYKNHWRATDAVDLEFAPPVEGPLSSRFGLRRFFNDQPRSPHSGLDFAAPKGTPVMAPSAGRVVGVGDFFFTGNAVYLDHGNGLISLYAHLDRVDVRAGDTLARGDLIGAVGKTGRATGPHLHWSIFMNGAAVDPELFLPTLTSQR
ncbi:MAG: peptidoglycan DD-metalloendopeptidase family protein [Thiotrichales bacterium]